VVPPYFDARISFASRAKSITTSVANRIDKKLATLSRAPPHSRPRARQIRREQPRLIRGRKPADPHHVRFAQQRGHSVERRAMNSRCRCAAAIIARSVAAVTRRKSRLTAFVLFGTAQDQLATPHKPEIKKRRRLPDGACLIF